jgi:hypothetical protein
MSLYDGPTTFFSTAWQPIQAFLLAISFEANAGADTINADATNALINFMCSLQLVTKQPHP